MIAVACLPVRAQAPQALRSPEVHSDHRPGSGPRRWRCAPKRSSPAFRFRAPNAKEVFLALEGAPRQPMQKDEQGVWSITTDPLEADLYGYSFVADSVTLFDPSNPVIKPNLLYTSSAVHVPGPASLPWEITDVPHGTIHQHFYKSGVVGDERDFYVYTPPGYDPKANRRYPVLYLLHGYSDEANAWTAVGRAHVILDNLIARGKAKPMLVVMPLGYGAPEVVSRGGPRSGGPNLWEQNITRFRDALLAEVIPQVEKTYVEGGPTHRSGDARCAYVDGLATEPGCLRPAAVPGQSLLSGPAPPADAVAAEPLHHKPARTDGRSV